MFAKVFEFETGQLLVINNHNIDSSKDEIIFRTDVDGAQLTQTLSFPIGESSTEVFNRITKDNSVSTYNALFNMGQDITVDIGEPKYSAFNLAIQVENMRNAQKMYFRLIGKARRTKLPEDLDKAETMKKLSIQLEASVDDSIRQMMQPIAEVIS